MLKRNPDPERLAFFAHQLFNFTSYNQVRPVASIVAGFAEAQQFVCGAMVIVRIQSRTALQQCTAAKYSTNVLEHGKMVKLDHFAKCSIAISQT